MPAAGGKLKDTLSSRRAGGVARIIGAMEWLISLALFVAVAAWVVAAYHRLHHLRSQVQEAWQQWEHATRQRNACLGDFAPVFAQRAPETVLLPHELRIAVESAELGLAGEALKPLPYPAHGQLPSPSLLTPLGERERELRLLVGDSLRLIDELPEPQQDAELRFLVSRLSASLFQQEQHTRLYNRAVEDYNNALTTPAGRLVASAFRLPAASALST